MNKLKMHSPDLTARNIDKLAELFPSVITELLDNDGNPLRAVDFDLLRQELSDHVVEGPQERYQLDWPGKRAALFAANAPIAKALRPVREKSVDFDNTKNLFIEGDNLDALKLLQESYLGKVKLIYIDPPYNTGNDFIYDDDFADTTAEYLVKSGQVDGEGTRLVANTEANGRFHSDWLGMMYPRMKLARNLLTEDGIVLISIDDGESANLRRLCDEVFGPQNFVGQFVWVTKNAARGVPPRTMLMANHEYVVAYARNTLFARFRGLDRDEADFSNPDNDARGLWRSESMKATGAQDNFFTIEDPVTGNRFNANWAFSSSRIDEMIRENLVLFPDNASGTPRQKKFIDSYVNERKAFVTNLGWFSTENATKALMALFDGAKVFDFPKPLELIRFLVEQATVDGDVVLDLFAGSSSTAHAVMAANSADGSNRSFIMVQLDETLDATSGATTAGFASISDLSKERIRRAGTQVLEGNVHPDWRGDTGFRVLKVDTTNMADVRRTPDVLGQDELDLDINSVKHDRTGEDLLFQVLIDWGLELSMRIDVEQLDGRDVFVVEDDALVACFAERVSPTVLRQIAARKPLRAVFRDSGFATDADRINAEQIFAETSPATDVKAI